MDEWIEVARQRKLKAFLEGDREAFDSMENIELQLCEKRAEQFITAIN